MAALRARAGSLGEHVGQSIARTIVGPALAGCGGFLGMTAFRAIACPAPWGVDINRVHFVLARGRVGHLLPDTSPPPSSLPALTFAIDDVAVIFGRSSSPALTGRPLNWQQHLQDTPLDLRQIAAAHGCLLESAALNQNRIFASMDFVHAA